MVEAARQTCESNEKLRQNFQLCLEENCRGPVEPSLHWTSSWVVPGSWKQSLVSWLTIVDGHVLGFVENVKKNKVLHLTPIMCQLQQLFRRTVS